MKRSNLIKLLSLIICAMMLVSVFASCDNGESKTTNAPEDDTTEAPVQTPTEAPDDETTEAPAQTPTEAPDDETTEAPETDAPETDAPETDAPEETDPETDAPECGGIHREWSSSVEGHWRDACQYCGGGAVELKAHAVDYNDEGVYCCLVCGFEPECKNIHWTWDSLNHYMPACDKCGFEGDEFAESPHFFITTEEGEFVCDTCGYVPECKGVHAWEADADTHSAPACDKCGAEAVEAMPHTVAEVVEDNAIKYACTECQYVCAERILPESVVAYLTPALMSQKTKSDFNAETGIGSKKDTWAPSEMFSMASMAVNTDGKYPFFTFAQGTAHADQYQFIWNRDAGGLKTWPQERYTINVGNANYLVIKARLADNAINYFKVVLSTVGVTGAVNSTGDPVGDPRKEIILPITATTNGEWTTFAINLEMAFGDSYNPSEDGTFDLDTFYLHFRNANKELATTLDIEYMAFVENDIEAIASMVEENKFIVVTGEKDSYTVVNTETMTCEDDKHVNGNCDDKCDVCGADGVAAGAHHNADCGDDACDDCGATGVQGVAHKNTNCNDDTCDVCGATEVAGPAHVNADCGDELCDVCGAEGVTSAPHVNVNCDDDMCDNCGVNGIPAGEHVMDCIAEEGEDGTQTYVATCMTCGFEYKLTVPASVNYFGSLDVMGCFNNNGSFLTKFLYDEKADVLYNRLESAASTHLNISGGTSGGAFTAYTCELGKYLVVKFRTFNNTSIEFKPGSEADRADKGTSAANYRGNSVGKNASEEWRVAVVDISGVAHYGEDPVATSNVYMMFMANYADVAYVAVVDSFEEIAELVTDETYVFYGTSFSNTGEVRNTADSTPVA